MILEIDDNIRLEISGGVFIYCKNNNLPGPNIYEIALSKIKNNVKKKIYGIIIYRLTTDISLTYSEEMIIRHEILTNGNNIPDDILLKYIFYYKKLWT